MNNGWMDNRWTGTNKWTDRQINGQMNEIYHLLG